MREGGERGCGSFVSKKMMVRRTSERGELPNRSGQGRAGVNTQSVKANKQLAELDKTQTGMEKGTSHIPKQDG